MLGEERVRVEALGQDEGVDVHPLFEAEGDGPGAGVLSGGVAVVVDDEAGREAGGLGDLERGQGRPQRGDDVADPGLVEGRVIRVSLDQDGLTGLADGVLADVQAVEELPLGVQGGVRRIEILRLGARDRPAAEGDDLARQAEDGEDDASPEPVVVFVLLLSGKGESGLLEEGGRDVLCPADRRRAFPRRPWRSRSSASRSWPRTGPAS